MRVMPKPGHADQEHEPELEQHQEQASNPSILKLDDGEGIARFERTLQHLACCIVVEVVKGQAKQSHDLATVGDKALPLCCLFVAGSCGADDAESTNTLIGKLRCGPPQEVWHDIRRVRSIDRLRNKRQVLRTC